MEQSTTILSITICGIDWRERSRIFKLIGKAGIVGSQILYKSDNTIYCSLPANKYQEIPDSFFDLISNHEGSSLKVESILIDAEVRTSINAEVNLAELSENAETKVESSTTTVVEEKLQECVDFMNEEIKEDFEEESNEKVEAKNEANNKFSEDSDKNSEVTEDSDTQSAKVKKNRGQVSLPKDFKDPDIDRIFLNLKAKQENRELTVEDKIQAFNELIANLEEVLDIRGLSKKDSFSRLMKLANKCFEKDYEKPVTTMAMRKEKEGVTKEEWNKVRFWLGEKVRKHGLTLSSFFEYIFKNVNEYAILLADSDSINESTNNMQSVAEESEEHSNKINKNLRQPVVMPIILEKKKEEFVNAFKEVMDSNELEWADKVKGVLAIFGVTYPEAIRLTCEVLKQGTSFDLSDCARKALIPEEDLTDVVIRFSMKLKESGFIMENTSLDNFLGHLKIMINLYES